MDKINGHDIVVGSILSSRNCGKFKIIRKHSPKYHEVEFIDTGYRTLAQNPHIRRGTILDRLKPSFCGVGYIGDGKYKSSGPNANKDAFVVWNNMIARCYNGKCKQFKDYGLVGVVVCKEWHNFQNFAEWYYGNYPRDGEKYELDKDIINRDRKLYSPSTCMFVTRSQNISERNKRNPNASSWRFTSPSGELIEFRNLRKFCKENNLHDGCMCDVFHGKRKAHKGWTQAK